MTGQIELSIIIINWNSAGYLRECIASIYAHTAQMLFEIIVVDNASFDGAREMLRQEFPEVIFIQSNQNVGFSKANNLAYEKSSGSALLFLNPDTVVLNSAIAMMYSHLNSSPRIGAVGSGVLNTDLSLQTHYVQAFPTILNQVLVSESAKRMFPKSSLWGLRPILEYDGHPVDVEVIAGSCVMVKREVFEETGRFDEDYFMYSEDVALCFAIRKCGYQIHYVREASVIHHGGKSSENKEESQFSIVMPRESMVLYFTKTRGNGYARLYKCTTAIAAFCRLLLIAAAIPFKRSVPNRRRLSSISGKWKTVLRWSLGLETIPSTK
jgi:GT2 family glycosyltransferase